MFYLNADTVAFSLDMKFVAVNDRSKW